MPMCGAGQGGNAKPVAQDTGRHLPCRWRDSSRGTAHPGASSLLHSAVILTGDNPSPRGPHLETFLVVMTHGMGGG